MTFLTNVFLNQIQGEKDFALYNKMWIPTVKDLFHKRLDKYFILSIQVKQVLNQLIR